MKIILKQQAFFTCFIMAYSMLCRNPDNIRGILAGSRRRSDSDVRPAGEMAVLFEISPGGRNRPVPYSGIPDGFRGPEKAGARRGLRDCSGRSGERPQAFPFSDAADLCGSRILQEKSGNGNHRIRRPGTGEAVTEAACIHDTLVSMGVPKMKILLEDQSVSTRENLRYSMKFGGKDKSYVIVTNGFHLFRAMDTGRSLGMKHISGLAASSEPVLLLNYYVREFFAWMYYNIMKWSGKI